MGIEAMSAVDNLKAAKRTAKDSVFRDLFGNPKYLLQLYQALHPEETDISESEIGVVTITNILLDQMYNDLGFTVGKDNPRLMILVEAQSTWTANVIVRILMYLTNAWKEYIQAHKLNVYGTTKIKLPKPELYVIYTGERKEHSDWISLANEFFQGENTFLDAKVKIIYDGKENDIIHQYITFTKIYQKQIQLLGPTRKAVLETIRICKDKNVLKEYLENREKEVIDIMMTLFDQEYAVERYGEEKMIEGIAKGKIEEKIAIAHRLNKQGLSDSAIAAAVDENVNTVQQWFMNPLKFPQ